MKALAEGLYVKHFQYGCGVITASDAERTSIEFDLHGPKKFVTSLMVVEPAEGTPPKRPRTKRRKRVTAAPVQAGTAAGVKWATPWWSNTSGSRPIPWSVSTPFKCGTP